MNWLCTVPAIVCDQISEWGQLSTRLTFHQQQIAADIARRIRQYREKARLTGNEINSGVHMLELVMKHAPQLLENMPDDTVSIPIDAPIGNIPDRMDVSLAKIQQAVAWDKRRRVLSIKYHLMLKDIAEGRKTLNQSNKQLVNDKISLLISHGLSFKE